MDLIKETLETKFTSTELAKIKYFYLCLLHEGSKFLIMWMLFSFMGRSQEYFIALFVLLSIRNTSGGIHLNRYLSCLAFTLSFLLGAILLSNVYAPTTIVQNIVLLVSVPVAFYIGPVTSKNRPPLTTKQAITSKWITCGVLLLYLLLFFCKETFIYRNLCFWVIVFQIAQLIVAKIWKKGEHHEKIEI